VQPHGQHPFSRTERKEVVMHVVVLVGQTLSVPMHCFHFPVAGDLPVSASTFILSTRERLRGAINWYFHTHTRTHTHVRVCACKRTTRGSFFFFLHRRHCLSFFLDFWFFFLGRLSNGLACKQLRNGNLHKLWGRRRAAFLYWHAVLTNQILFKVPRY